MTFQTGPCFGAAGNRIDFAALSLEHLLVSCAARGLGVCKQQPQPTACALSPMGHCFFFFASRSFAYRAVIQIAKIAGSERSVPTGVLRSIKSLVRDAE